MLIEIVGMKRVDFITKDGKEIYGQKIYFTFPDDNTRGVACDSAFLSNRKEITPEPSLPAAAELFYNKFGKVDDIKIIK